MWCSACLSWQSLVLSNGVKCRYFFQKSCISYNIIWGLKAGIQHCLWNRSLEWVNRIRLHLNIMLSFFLQVQVGRGFTPFLTLKVAPQVYEMNISTPVLQCMFCSLNSILDWWSNFARKLKCLEGSSSLWITLLVLRILSPVERKQLPGQSHLFKRPND